MPFSPKRRSIAPLASSVSRCASVSPKAKPFARAESRPSFCPYAPGHKAGKLVCGDARVLVNEPLGLVEPQPVVLYQLLRSLTQSDFTARSVRRERCFDIETFHKLQAAQVIAERIGNAVPRADVRAYVKKNMVAEENELSLFVKKAKMPRGVPRRCKAAQLVAAVAQHVAVVKLTRRECAGREFYGRGFGRPQRKILFRHAFAQNRA